jgi:RNA polymerase sigma-70 factor (ECF subfamily)
MGNQADRIRRAEALWAHFGPAISRTLVAYERDAELRQDLTQEVFLAILGSIERIEAASHRKAYLFRIAHNVAVDHVAREAKYAWVELDEAIADPGVDPAGDADAAGERGRLLEAVRQLRLPYRQVIVLALEGFEHEEIAEVLGIEAGTVRVRYFRAKTRLKELLNHAR